MFTRTTKKCSKSEREELAYSKDIIEYPNLNGNRHGGEKK